jgi:dipeptidyl aminopeptidase/acylaminoacyl peptidase
MTIPARGGPAADRGIRVTPWFGSSLSYSADGRFLAFSDRATDGGPFVVKLLELATGEVRPLTQPSPDFSGDAFPRFSPDGRRVALARLSASADVASADIYVVAVEGGAPVRLTRDQRFLGDLDWSRDGREILFLSDRSLANVRYWRVGVAGGEPTLVWSGGDPFPTITFAESFMDVSHAFRFSVARDVDRIAVTKRVYDTNIFRLDPRAPAPEPRLFIGSSETDDSPQISPDGQKIAFTSMRSGQQEIWLCTGEGTACTSIARTPNGGTPRWAPDSGSLVYDEWSPQSRHADVFTIDVRTLAVRRITSLDDADDIVPSFSRDGKSIYFASNRTGSWQVFRTSATGGAAVQLTRDGGFAAFEAPSGDPVFYTRFNAPGLFEVPRAGGKETRRLDQPRCWGQWAMAPDGIYLLDSREGQKTRLEFEGYGGGPPREIASLAQQPPCAESSLAVSPDGSFLLWVGIEEGSDIFRVDDFGPFTR